MTFAFIGPGDRQHRGLPGEGLPILDAAPRVRHTECEPYCAGKHLARALTVRVLVGAAGQVPPWRYGKLRSATADRAHYVSLVMRVWS